MKTKSASVFQYLMLGLQHVFTMNVYVAPLILAQLIGLDADHTAELIQMTFLASGLATLIQVSAGIRLPVMQGPSFVPLGALAAVGKDYGFTTVLGSTIPGAVGIILLSYPLQTLGNWAKRWITPLVGGTITVIIGVSLIPLALQSLSSLPGNGPINFGVAAFTGLTLLGLGHIKLGPPRLRGIIQSTSVIVALAIGTLALSLLTSVEIPLSHPSAWFALPRWFPFGAPEFHLEPMVLVTLVYAVILIESIGTWYVVGTVIKCPIDERLVNRGGLGQGLGGLAAALVGSTPITGYSANAGILSITKNYSRWVAVSAGSILLILGMAPRLIQIFATIPAQAMLGVFLAACFVIAYNGFLVVRTFGLNLRVKVLVGVPVLLSILVSITPSQLLQALPASVAPFLSSGICVGALSTIFLNRLWSENS